MRRRGHRGRTDANQPAIVRELRRFPGMSVAVTSDLGDGFADIVVGFRRFNFMYEIKDPDKSASAQKLTGDEERFHRTWSGHIAVAHSAQQIITDVLAQARWREQVCNSTK